MEKDNSIKDSESPERQDVSAAPNVPGFNRPTQKSKRPVEKVLMTVSAIETRTNRGVKTK